MIYIVLITMSGALHVILAIISFMNRKAFEGTKAFLWFSSFTAIYAFGYALSLASTDIGSMKFWTAVQYLGMPFSAPATLILVFHFIGLGKHLNKKTYFLYYLIPSISFLLVATNDFHHLFYQSVYLDYLNQTPVLQITVGQWYLIHGAYTFGTLAIAFVLLIIHWVKSKTKQTVQMIILLIGVTVPISTALVYLLGLTPAGLDPVPITMLFTSSLYLYAIITTKFLLVPPIEKDYILESMGDAVLVLDQTYHVKDYNHSASLLFSHVKIGTHIASLIGIDNPILPLFKKVTKKAVVTEVNLGEEYYQVKLSSLKNKDFNILGITMVFTNITEQKKEQLNLTKLAYTDALTQIYNRGYALEAAQKMFAQYPKIAAILFDIDHFKNINDTYGHFAGDEALKHVTKVCKRNIRKEIVIGRYGGEEFILFLLIEELEEALNVASRLRSKIEQSNFIYNDTVIRITASFGVAMKRNQLTLDQLIGDADRALYGAKREGRNTVCLAVEGDYMNIASTQSYS